MGDNLTVTDYNDKPVTVGTRVRMWDFEEGHPEFPVARARYEGVVIEITDFEGDVDDDTGRSIEITPDVRVRFDSGDEQSFSTCEWEHDQRYVATKDPDDPDVEWLGATGKVEELAALD